MLIVNFVDGADVRMIQRRSSLGLALKAAERLRVFAYIVGQELQSHEAAEFQILSLVHNAHAPAAQFLENAVMRDGVVDH